MERSEMISAFIEYDFDKCIIIEPEMRYRDLKERVMKVIRTYNPRVIVKAGLGRGELILDIIKEFKCYFVVVDYSQKAVELFREKYRGRAELENIRFIVGDFTLMPVDYYAADMLLCLDYFDFLETSMVVDEFRRILQFEGILVLSSVVLSENDLEGLYDDYMKMVFPLHNDFYLESDLKTFLGLNDFKYIQGDIQNYNQNISTIVSHFKGLYNIEETVANTFIAEHKDDFIKLYNFEKETMRVPYYVGVFMREKMA